MISQPVAHDESRLKLQDIVIDPKNFAMLGGRLNRFKANFFRYPDFDPTQPRFADCIEGCSRYLEEFRDDAIGTADELYRFFHGSPAVGKGAHSPWGRNIGQDYAFAISKSDGSYHERIEHRGRVRPATPPGAPLAKCAAVASGTGTPTRGTRTQKPTSSSLRQSQPSKPASVAAESRSAIRPSLTDNRPMASMRQPQNSSGSLAAQASFTTPASGNQLLPTPKSTTLSPSAASASRTSPVEGAQNQRNGTRPVTTPRVLAGLGSGEAGGFDMLHRRRLCSEPLYCRQSSSQSPLPSFAALRADRGGFTIPKGSDFLPAVQMTPPLHATPDLNHLPNEVNVRYM